MDAPTLVPNVDVELIPLPFLLFNNSKLRTANAGARVLLGLLDANLETYTFEAVFPPAAFAGLPESGKRKNEGHLQILTAKVQSSQELLKLKAAVYNSESDGSLRSVLIVDVSILSLPSSPTLSNVPNNTGSEYREPIQVPEHHPSHPSIPKLIKRHSGDIRKIFGHERRKSQIGPSQLQQQHQIEQPVQSLPSPPENQPVVKNALSASTSRPFSKRPSSIDLSPAKQPSTLSASSMPTIVSRGSDSTQSSGSTSAKSKTSTGQSLRPPTEEAGLIGELAQSALATHPRTGVIICRSDLASGFINSRTRELLMGIKSPRHEATDPFDDQFVSPASARVSHLMREQKDFSPSWEDDFDFEDGDVRIEPPDKGINLQTSIADILRWSLRRRRARQHHRSVRDDSSIRSGRSYSPATSLGGSGIIRKGSASFGDASTVPDSGDALRPWLAHKPYKCYDSSFSQRIEDPFESLFDKCVRKGQELSEALVMVGVETEVGPAEMCSFPESECFTFMTESTDPMNPHELVMTRVRRRIVSARAVSLRDVEGQHIGGVVWLRDSTGEMLPPPTTPLASSSSSGNYLKATYDPPASSPGFQAPSFTHPTGSDPFWQQIVNSMPHMVWVTKPDGEHVYFNNKW